MHSRECALFSALCGTTVIWRFNGNTTVEQVQLKSDTTFVEKHEKVVSLKQR